MTKARDLSLAAKAPLASPVFTGNVGIGVTPEAWNSNFTAVQLGDGALMGGVTGTYGTAVSSNVYFDGSWKYLTTGEASMHHQYNGQHVLNVASSGSADAAISWTNAMTITNDGFVTLAPNTSMGSGGVLNLRRNDGNRIIETMSFNASTQHHHVFENNSGTNVGSITVSTSATAYNTSSDYRLKENVTPMSGATAQTKLLKPCNFDWIAGGNVNGFIAHELADVVPEAVSGTKDAMMDEEYEVTAATDTEAAVMGTRSVPDLQGIDQSKLVPLLTATIQELITRIEALEA